MLSGIFSSRVDSVKLLSWKQKTFLLFFPEGTWNVSIVQYMGFLSIAYGRNIINLPLIEQILQRTISSKMRVMGEKERGRGGTTTDERRPESHISQLNSVGLG